MIKDNYKILVLMSTYNGEKYLSVQLESILNQTISEHVFIYVRDDGSQDNTTQILEKYKKTGKLDYYCENNIGSAQSFHHLLHAAPSAEYYAFADQDDYWLPKKLENAVNALKKYDIPALYGTTKIIVDRRLSVLDQKDVIPQLDNFFNILTHRNEISGCTIVFNERLRKLYMQVPSNKITYGVYHDSWMVKLAALLGKIVFSTNAQILYRQHGDNVVGEQKQGKTLFLERLKNIDWTFQKYRKRNFVNPIAKIFLDTYGQQISQEKKRLLYDFSHIHNDVRSRIDLFFKPGLSKHPLYEYVIYKIFIILGWWY